MAAPSQNIDSKENENGKIKLIIPNCLQNGVNVNLKQDLAIINPDIHQLFNKYNKLYFDGDISFCEVKWIDSTEEDNKENKNNNSNGHMNNMNINNINNNNMNINKKPDIIKKKEKKQRKKKYAGQCKTDNSGFCCISLEKSILQFKSSKYVIETLIHQMIHSYILTKNGAKSLALNKKQETIGHSTQFKQIMKQINRKSHGFIKLTLNNKQCKQNDDFPSEIIPDQLYLGNIHHALNLETLKELKITHVVNCTKTINNAFASDGITYCQVPVNDKTSVSILPYFVKAIRFIESVREENGNNNANKILIHCHAGISRSATITIAYLMYSWKLTMFDAITHVQSKRYIIQPNQGFKNQLLDFYLYLEENEGNLDDFEQKNQIKQNKIIMPENDKISCNPIQGLMGGNNNGNHNENKPKNNQKDNTKEYVACPVCDKFFTIKYINKHLDECVAK